MHKLMLSISTRKLFFQDLNAQLASQQGLETARGAICDLDKTKMEMRSKND